MEITEQNTKTVKSSTNNDHFTGGFTSFAISLLTRLKRVGLSTNPYGTPFENSCRFDECWSRRAEKKR